MLVSYRWLQDFIVEELPSPSAVAAGISDHTLEVEDVYTVGLYHPGVVVGRIQRIEKHPNADRLSVTFVDLGGGDEHQIICGASNIAEGALVPVATVGTTLPDGTEIKAATIRDVESNGMICSPAELGRESETDLPAQAGGIWLLERGTPGQLFDELMELGTDTVFDIDVLPHRGADCLSHRGVAREVAAIFSLTFREAVSAAPAADGTDALEAVIDDPHLARRYSGAVLRGVRVGESPAWLQERLRAVGERPINNVVDATNYVMLAIGQPLHAFDADKLTTDNGTYRLGVRAAKEGETITALNGEQYTLPAGAQVIGDDATADRTAIAVAGIIGGQDTAVDDNTTTVVLESANFDPTSVRLTAQALKLATNSSKRFEYNISPEMTLPARDMVINLLQQPDEDQSALTAVADTYPAPADQPTVSVSTKEVSALLGYDIQAATIEQILTALGFTVSDHGDAFAVMPPRERRDIFYTQDVIEEVARLYGYDHVPYTPLPAPETQPTVNQTFYWTHRLRDIFVNHGFSEVQTYVLKAHGEREIENPLAQDKKFYRANLTDGLTESLQHNSQYVDLLGLAAVKIFEIGNVYKDGKETTRLGIGVGQTKRAPTSENITDAVQELSTALGVDLRSFEVAMDENGGVFEVDCDGLVAALGDAGSYDEFVSLSDDVVYQPVSPYPYVLRDVAVWVPVGTEPEAVTAVITANAGSLLVNHYLFDTYERGDATSYAFRLVFQSATKTLSDEEVNEVMEGVYQQLQVRDGWEIR